MALKRHAKLIKAINSSLRGKRFVIMNIFLDNFPISQNRHWSYNSEGFYWLNNINFAKLFVWNNVSINSSRSHKWKIHISQISKHLPLKAEYIALDLETLRTININIEMKNEKWKSHFCISGQFSCVFKFKLLQEFTK